MMMNLNSIGIPPQAPLPPQGSPLTGPTPSPPAGGATFGNLLKGEIDKVNALQQDAQVAAEDFAAGRRTDVEGVLYAAKKADTAFKMLLQVRNKVLEAYEEVKQMRV